MAEVSRSVSPDRFCHLHQAVAAGDTALVGVLLSSGEDVNKADDGLFNATPLMVAAGVGNVDMVELLLQHGANQTLVNGRGVNAVMFAAFLGKPQVKWFFFPVSFFNSDVSL